MEFYKGKFACTHVFIFLIFPLLLCIFKVKSFLLLIVVGFFHGLFLWDFLFFDFFFFFAVVSGFNNSFSKIPEISAFCV